MLKAARTAFPVAFHYGLSDGGEGERNLAHFYPPFRFQDRLKNILVPILKSAKRYPPTLVELGTGTWDLQHWTFEDREADVDRMSFVSSSRAEWYRERFATALATVEEVFAQENQEERVSLMFREMQFTKMVDSVPPPRVQGLKNLQSHIMKEKIDNGSWSIDPLARLILGQEHYYRGEIIMSQVNLRKVLQLTSSLAFRLHTSYPAASWQNLGRHNASSSHDVITMML